MTVLFPTPPSYCSHNAHALRQSPESEPIHPYLHESGANRDASATNSRANIKCNSSSAEFCQQDLTTVNIHGQDANPRQLNDKSPKSSTNVYPASERAACVPDTRFVRVTAVLAELGGVK